MEVQQYSLTRFWRYIFTPLILVTLAFGWYVIFTLPGVQLAPSLPAISTNTFATANLVSTK